jgi:glycerol-3-phosphate dehydrogenase
VLPLGDGSTTSARRETVYLRGPSGMLSVAGGKLTTHRRIALTALGLLRAELGLPRLDRRPFPLPGAIDPDEGVRRLARRVPDLPPAVRAHLVHLYGSLAEEVLAPTVADPDLLRPIHPDGPDVAAQAVYACDVEWAHRAEDVLRRRTTLALRGLSGEDVVTRVEELVNARSGKALQP